MTRALAGLIVCAAIVWALVWVARRLIAWRSRALTAERELAERDAPLPRIDIQDEPHRRNP